MPVGSIRKLIINGIPLNVKNDANIKETWGKYDVEGIQTTGGNIPKLTLRAEMRENIDCVANVSEKKQIREIANEGAFVPCSYTDADGVTIKASCIVEISDANTADGLMQLRLHPQGQWT